MSACRSTIERLLFGAVVAVLAAACANASEISVDVKYESAALKGTAQYSVVRPDKSADPLPVVYLLHGRDSSAAEWLRLGNVAPTLDRLIAEHRIPPLMVVLPDAANGWYVDGPAMAMETAVVRDLVADVERRYRVRTDRAGRAIAGNSMGGFGAVRIALGYPERYAAAASMSGAFWIRVTREMAIDETMAGRLARVFSGSFGQPFDPKFFVTQSPEEMARKMPSSVPQPALYLTASRGDRFRLNEEQDTMAILLRKYGLEVATDTTEGDHDWGTWSSALPDVLAFLGRSLASK
jgi:S-formylglutathione hydrolase FrmB